MVTLNRVNVLCAMNRVMMEAFSQRAVEGLEDYTLLLALPPFRSFLDIATKSAPARVVALLQEAREIDQIFVRKAPVFAINRRWGG